MTGRVTKLIDDQQFGTISGEDGIDYRFEGRALLGVQFFSLHVGVRVTFVASPELQRASAVRIAADNPIEPLGT
jgi:cold shock CspA family protein